VTERPLLLVIGAGTQTYREYAFISVAEAFRIWLFADRVPTWELPYLTGHTVLDTADAAGMAAPAAAIGPDAVLTWDDTRVVQTASLAEALSLPGAGPDAALCCRDKHRTRTALAAAGVPQAGSELVTSLGAARAAAERIGYPVVLKPQALNASMGVVRVDSPDQLAARFRVARGATAPGGRATEVEPGGVLVEEYLDGPEVSADAGWIDGSLLPGLVARKQVGYPPYFEEVGHLVDGTDPLQSDPQLWAVVEAAHQAIGFRTGWTHTELRLTPAGPKVIEINARLGGDRIPQLGIVALGVDGPAAAAALAAGEKPTVLPTRRRAAAVRFLYPSGNCIARAVHVDRDRLPACVSAVEVVAAPGQELLLPPAGHVSSRYALALAVADTGAECLAGLAAVDSAVRLDVLAPRAVRR
jgi:biotin carboxylase